jgi:hypothetical protein
METQHNYQHSQPGNGKPDQPAKGNKNFFQRPPVHLPLPSRQDLPSKPDENHDPTRLIPGVNEPEKNDPTRTVEKPVSPPEPPE